MKSEVCPVCGYPHLHEAPHTLAGGASYEICPCCGFHFGYDDDYRRIAYHQWRRAWIAGGCTWFSNGRQPPVDWDPAAQLLQILDTSRASELAETVQAAPDFHGIRVEPAEVDRWRWMILEDEWTSKYRLDREAKQDAASAVAVCRYLLEDAAPVVQRIAIEKLAQYGAPADILEIVYKRLFAQDWHVRGTALWILRDLPSPMAFEVLLVAAEQGCAGALNAACARAASVDDQRRILHLARRALLSPQAKVRRAALDAIQALSSVPVEEALLVRAVEQYRDRSLLRALSRASIRIIPNLRSLLGSPLLGRDEKETIQQAIHSIELRQSELQV